MSRDVSDNMRSQMYATEMYGVPLVTLDIHAGEGVSIHVVNNNEDIEFNSVLYQAAAFRFSLPDEEEESLATARITIPNIDRAILSVLRSYTGTPTVVARVILVNEDSIEEEAGPWAFELRSIVYTKNEITGVLVYEFKHQRNLSTVRYTASLFPSLHVPT